MANNSSKYSITVFIGEKKPIIPCSLRKISFKEVELFTRVSYPVNTYLYCLIDAKIYEKVLIKGRVVESELVSDKFGETKTLIRLLVVYNDDKYITLLKKISVFLDRRKNKRYPVKLKVEFFYPDRFPESVSKNLSLTGVSIYTSTNFKKGDVINFKIKLPEVLDEIVVVGRVIYTKRTNGENLVGIEFVQLIPDARKKLENLLKKLEENKIKYETFEIKL